MDPRTWVWQFSNLRPNQNFVARRKTRIPNLKFFCLDNKRFLKKRHDFFNGSFIWLTSFGTGVSSSSVAFTISAVIPPVASAFNSSSKIVYYPGLYDWSPTMPWPGDAPVRTVSSTLSEIGPVISETEVVHLSSHETGDFCLFWWGQEFTNPGEVPGTSLIPSTKPYLSLSLPSDQNISNFFLHFFQNSIFVFSPNENFFWQF